MKPVIISTNGVHGTVQICMKNFTIQLLDILASIEVDRIILA